MPLTIIGRFDPDSKVRLVSAGETDPGQGVRGPALRPPTNPTLVETAYADAAGTVSFAADVPMPESRGGRERRTSPYWVLGKHRHLPVAIRAVTIGPDSALAQPPLEPDQRWTPKQSG